MIMLCWRLPQKPSCLVHEVKQNIIGNNLKAWKKFAQFWQFAFFIISLHHVKMWVGNELKNRSRREVLVIIRLYAQNFRINFFDKKNQNSRMNNGDQKQLSKLDKSATQRSISYSLHAHIRLKFHILKSIYHHQQYKSKSSRGAEVESTIFWMFSWLEIFFPQINSGYKFYPTHCRASKLWCFTTIQWIHKNDSNLWCLRKIKDIRPLVGLFATTAEAHVHLEMQFQTKMHFNKHFFFFLSVCVV